MMALEITLPPLIPRAVLFGNPEKAGPQISPDGTRLAYLAPENGVLNVWVRTLGLEDDAVVTSDTLRGIRGYFWQGDSQVFRRAKSPTRSRPRRRRGSGTSGRASSPTMSPMSTVRSISQAPSRTLSTRRSK